MSERRERERVWEIRYIFPFYWARLWSLNLIHCKINLIPEYKMCQNTLFHNRLYLSWVMFKTKGMAVLYFTIEYFQKSVDSSNLNF